MISHFVFLSLNHRTLITHFMWDNRRDSVPCFRRKSGFLVDLTTFPGLNQSKGTLCAVFSEYCGSFILFTYVNKITETEQLKRKGSKGLQHGNLTVVLLLCFRMSGKVTTYPVTWHYLNEEDAEQRQTLPRLELSSQTHRVVNLFSLPKLPRWTYNTFCGVKYP
jgi:hypothetical protein